ncbi:MAG: esterase [Bacteroidales bacterium]|nr:esterase [Bacteroidales bacterium]
MMSQYFKEFPELMRDKTVMYIHGFGSSAQSGTVKLLRQLMPNARVIARDVPLKPDDAIAMLRKMVAEERPDLIIATSMGGMLGEMLRGVDRILVNPAFEMGKTMHEHGMIGKLVWSNPREDGETETVVTKALAKEYEALTQQCFQGLDDEDREHVWGMFGDKDDTVDTRDLFLEHYPRAITFHGGHRLVDTVVTHYLSQVIRWIDDRQRGIERQTIVIDHSTMRDQYGNAYSSLLRAVETLAETYNVRFLCPAPTNDPQSMVDWSRWLTEELSVAAYDRVIFSNQPAMLYADYLITRHPEEDALATCLEFGKDDFKSWDDILVYFSRLG